MAELSDKERLSIQTHGLEGAMAHLRPTLGQVIELVPSPLQQADASSHEEAEREATDADSETDDVVLCLLHALRNHRVAKDAQSGGQLLRTGVSKSFYLFGSDKMEITAFHPLIHAVVHGEDVGKKSDFAVWEEALRLLASTSRHTMHPPSTPPSGLSAFLGDTPRTHNAVSLWVSEQARYIDDDLRTELRDGRGFNDSQLLQSPQALQTADESYIDHVLSCRVTQPAGRPLTEFQTPRTLLRALRDAIRHHCSLFLDEQILHQDISPSNITLVDPTSNQGRYGMLINLEPRIRVEDGKNIRPKDKRMIDTHKYLAIEMLETGFRDGNIDIEHTYRHDLESFFYVFLDMCIHQGWDKGKEPRYDRLSEWHVRNYERNCRSKVLAMDLRYFNEMVLAKFSPVLSCVKGLATDLRDALFQRSLDLRVGTPAEPPQALYDQMTAAIERSIAALPMEGEAVLS